MWLKGNSEKSIEILIEFLLTIGSKQTISSHSRAWKNCARNWRLYIIMFYFFKWLAHGKIVNVLKKQFHHKEQFLAPPGTQAGDTKLLNLRPEPSPLRRRRIKAMSLVWSLLKDDLQWVKRLNFELLHISIMNLRN